ncbi:DUF4212 domain-containing protein [Aquincola sp. MAHUQ-54]|uniref:DUF4212 domain-containing protein n=1 Tax=Aquincola agrisoli TaxID=3119538 RepID=A0AAW9QCZ9_9BURK
MAEPAPPPPPATAYWRRNCRLIAGLLTVWFCATFGTLYFARDLSFQFFNWPFSFWVAAQGALVLYVVIIAAYARVMNRADRQAREAQSRAPGARAYNDT